MSKITLAPNASGTGALTVAAPSTNTDRTLTLPDATGTVNISGLANEVPAGSAGSPSIYSTGDSNTGVFFPAADTVAVTTGGSERMRIDSSGNVGINTSTPSKKLEVYAASASLQINSIVKNDTSAAGVAAIGFNVSSSAAGEATSTKAGIGLQRNFAFGGGFLCFYSNNSGAAGDFTTADERMRIDGSGNVGINTTSPGYKLDIASSDTTSGLGYTARLRANATAGAAALQFTDAAATAEYGVIACTSAGQIKLNSTTVLVSSLAGTGSRAVNASATGVLSAASDSRLKQEVPEASIAGLAEIMQLRPVAYKWLDDIENRGDDAAVELGFFADEAKDIIPSAAPMGNDGYYGFYDRAVIAALTKAVQEQQQMIQALQADIAALKGV